MPCKATSRDDHDVDLAIDASTTCNAIYAHNFGHKPSQRRVETTKQRRRRRL